MLKIGLTIAAVMYSNLEIALIPFSVAEVGSEEVARDPEVRVLRARLKRAEQELDILKRALVIFGQPTR